MIGRYVNTNPYQVLATGQSVGQSVVQSPRGAIRNKHYSENGSVNCAVDFDLE